MKKAVIVGGGIGGLTAAVALQASGCEVLVLERANEITTQGAGILLQNNAMMALERLDLSDDVAAAGVRVRGGRISTRSGRLLAELDWSDVPLGVGIHRANLLRIMSRHVGLENIRTSAAVIRYRQVGERVVVVLESGDEVDADLLVGADGIHSTVRAQRFGDGSPRYSGYTCWRGLTHMGHDFRRGEVFEIWGAGKRFGGVHVDERLYWFAPVNASEGGTDRPGQVRTALLGLFEGWPKQVEITIKATEESAILRNDIMDRPFRSGWGEGRMTLLGDAAHPMTPDLGQGACQAIEDAVVLGRCISENADPLVALRRYERLRLARTRRFVFRSRVFGRIAQWEHPVARWVRDSVLRGIPEFVLRRDMQESLLFEG